MRGSLKLGWSVCAQKVPEVCVLGAGDVRSCGGAGGLGRACLLGGVQ